MGRSRKQAQLQYNKLRDKYRENDAVDVIRNFSNDMPFFNTLFEDGYFDIIFIDGDHSYEGCLKDLKQAWTKVKIGGSLFGDDYKWGTTKLGKSGVTRALDAFCDEYKVYPKAFGEIEFEIKVQEDNYEK